MSLPPGKIATSCQAPASHSASGEASDSRSAPASRSATGSGSASASASYIGLGSRVSGSGAASGSSAASGTRTSPRGNSALRSLLLSALVLCGCSADTPSAAEAHPCPPGGTTLTYENFGKPFMDANCQPCHGARVGQRQGAPEGYDFATREGVRAHLDRVYATSADGNSSMPPGPDDPPATERTRLGEWLGCGAP